MTSNIVALGTGCHLSLRQIAEESGFDRDTVKRRIAVGRVKPSGERGGHPVYRLRDVLPALYVNDDGGHIDPDKLDPFARHAHYKGDNEKLKYLEEMRELIPRAEVERDYAYTFMKLAMFLDTFVDVLERGTGMQPAQLAIADQVVTQLRNELYLSLAEKEDEDEDDGGGIRISG